MFCVSRDYWDFDLLPEILLSVDDKMAGWCDSDIAALRQHIVTVAVKFLHHT